MTTFNKGIESFHERLKELIGSKSVRAFGDKVGISEGGLRKYLQNGSKPTFDKLVAIAEYSRVNLQWLATGEGDKHSCHQEDLKGLFPQKAVEMFISEAVRANNDAWQARYNRLVDSFTVIANTFKKVADND